MPTRKEVLMRSANLLNDFAFKYVFGEDCKEANDALKSLLTVFLERKVNHVVVKNSEMVKDYSKMKSSRLDLLVEFNDKTTVDLEMQLRQTKDNLMNRFSYYLARLHGSQDMEGKSYGQLKETIVMIFFNVNIVENDNICNKKNWMNKYDKDNAYKLDPSDYDLEEDYLDALRSCWQDKYDPSFKCDIEVDGYDTEEDYRNALILDWQNTYDLQHQFNGFNFDKFTTIDDYLVELNDRLNWIKECDPEGKYSKIDASNYDNLIQYKHQINLRKAWKNKYDPNNEHTNIDPCDYSSVDEYHEAIMDD